MEDQMFVGGKPTTEVRKRVGDIRFWLEDRENRRAKAERQQVNAFTEANHVNFTSAKATTTLRPKRKTTTPRRILSHIESKGSYIISLSALC